MVSTHCSAPKKGSDKVRMCVDLSHLNKYVRREYYPLPTPPGVVADITAKDAKYFPTLDVAKGTTNAFWMKKVSYTPPSSPC